MPSPSPSPAPDPLPPPTKPRLTPAPPPRMLPAVPDPKGVERRGPHRLPRVIVPNNTVGVEIIVRIGGSELSVVEDGTQVPPDPPRGGGGGEGGGGVEPKREPPRPSDTPMTIPPWDNPRLRIRSGRWRIRPPRRRRRFRHRNTLFRSVVLLGRIGVGRQRRRALSSTRLTHAGTKRRRSVLPPDARARESHARPRCLPCVWRRLTVKI